MWSQSAWNGICTAARHRYKHLSQPCNMFPMKHYRRPNSCMGKAPPIGTDYRTNRRTHIPHWKFLQADLLYRRQIPNSKYHRYRHRNHSSKHTRSSTAYRYRSHTQDQSHRPRNVPTPIHQVYLRDHPYLLQKQQDRFSSRKNCRPCVSSDSGYMQVPCSISLLHSGHSPGLHMFRGWNRCAMK